MQAMRRKIVPDEGGVIEFLEKVVSQLRHTAEGREDPRCSLGTLSVLSVECPRPGTLADTSWRMSVHFDVSARITRSKRKIVESAQLIEKDQIR